MSVRPLAASLLEYLLPARRARMVGWYDPAVLARSAALLTVANLFGRHSDTRLIEALASQPQREFRFGRDGEEFWFDYAADLGDGWNPTYAVAELVARPQLEVADRAGVVHRTCGGEVLIFGGDEVYPYPSKEEYARRTEAPYAAAFAGVARQTNVFAIPGNHDWYDSLVAFSRLFCRPERGFAGLATHQTRSYFALALPANWWLFAIDLQLGAELDEPQVRYFQDVARHVPADAGVILCVPEPQWLLEQTYPDHPRYEGSVLRAFEEKILQRSVSVFLTGDLHFYKRHANEAGVQKIVAGGGGAFLHPTHGSPPEPLPGGFTERACYPDKRISRGLTWWNLLFPLLNPKYLPIPAVLYTLSAWLASASLDVSAIAELGSAFKAAATAAIRDPFNGLWLILFVSAFVFFTDTHVRWYRVTGGIAHALAHLGAAFGLGWFSIVLSTRWLGLEFGAVPQMLLSGAITFVGGGIVGSIVLGAYLFISLRVFGRHANEAFSSLRVQDYKHWLRLRIDPQGTLTIHAIAIDRVPRRWREQTVDGRKRIVADDRDATPPRLVDVVTVPHPSVRH